MPLKLKHPVVFFALLIMMSSLLAISSTPVFAEADTGTVTGTVLLPPGMSKIPLNENPYIEFYKEKTPGTWAMAHSSAVNIDESNSSFSTEVAPGTYRVALTTATSSESCQTTRLAATTWHGGMIPIDVTTGATTSNVNFAPALRARQQYGLVQGRINDSSGKPLSGTTVSLYRTVAEDSCFTTTDAAGQYEIAISNSSKVERFTLSLQNPQPGVLERFYYPNSFTDYDSDSKHVGFADVFRMKPGKTKTIDMRVPRLDSLAKFTITLSTIKGSPFQKAMEVQALRKSKRKWRLVSEQVVSKKAHGIATLYAPPGSYRIVTKRGYRKPSTYDREVCRIANARTHQVKAGRSVAITNRTSSGKICATKNPKLSGKPRIGVTLRIVGQSWNSKTKNRSYTWYRDGKRIRGAKKPTYRLRKKDRGSRIQVRIKAKAAKKSGGVGTTVSKRTRVVR